MDRDESGFLGRIGRASDCHHVHLHVCATDGVFVPTGDGRPVFLPARPITQADLATLTEKVRRHVVRWFRIQRLLDADAAADMIARETSGFSVDASVRITVIDRDVLPRHKAANWVGPGRGGKSKRPGVSGVVELAPLEFIDRLADLVPRPRKHRHRYHGMFAPNHKLRSAVTAHDKRECRQAA